MSEDWSPAYLLHKPAIATVAVLIIIITDRLRDESWLQ